MTEQGTSQEETDREEESSDLGAATDLVVRGELYLLLSSLRSITLTMERGMSKLAVGDAAGVERELQEMRHQIVRFNRRLNLYVGEDGPEIGADPTAAVSSNAGASALGLQGWRVGPLLSPEDASNPYFQSGIKEWYMSTDSFYLYDPVSGALVPRSGWSEHGEDDEQVEEQR